MLLATDEPAAFEIVNAGGAGNAVLVCDHASNRLPRRLGTLGLGAVHLADHIVVMYRGTIIGSMARSDATLERIGLLMGGAAA